MAGLIRNVMVIGLMAVLSPVNQGDESGAAANVLAAIHHGKPATGSVQDHAATAASAASALGKGLARGWSEMDPGTREIMLAMAVSGLTDRFGDMADEPRKPALQTLAAPAPRR
jgi:hypothetical protein